MERQLIVAPSGHPAIRATADENPAAVLSGGAGRRIARAFEASPAEGLFAVAVEADRAALAPALLFWRDFGGRYLTELCQHSPTDAPRVDPVAPPAREQLESLLTGLPPLPGGEYLTADALTALWRDLDDWTRGEIARHEGGLAGFLQDRAPLWHQVGRVCFHLAEHKGDPEYPFAFLATYSPGLSRGAKVQYQPLSQALKQYAGARNKPALVRLLSPVERAAEQSAWMRELVDSGDIFHPLAWTPGEAYRFLKEAPLYESSGVLVRLPDWWRKRPRPQVGVVIGQKRQHALGADAMLDFNVTLALGDQKLTERQWRALMESDDGLVLLKGRWVEVDRDKLAAALDHWKQVERASSDGMLSFAEGMRLLAGAPADLAADDDAALAEREWTFARAGDWLGQVLQELRDPAAAGGPEPGERLRAELRPYQQTGVQWLWLMSGLGLGACLADDMGLGKTIQVLALLLMHKSQEGEVPAAQQKPSLLVLPASLLANWKSELQRFAPSLNAAFVHPSETDKPTLARMAAAPEQAFQDVDVVLTTYGILQRQAWLQDLDWRIVALDEAQAIKNPSTRQSRAVKKLRAQARVALTGTPVENRLADLWSLFDFLCPGLLGSAAKFKKFVRALERQEQGGYAPLRNLVRPYILRRMKTDKSIIADLPEKTEVQAFCGLSKRQAMLYEKSVAEMSRAIREMEGIQRRGLVLSYLMRFKQICNHPSQLLGDGAFRPDDSGKFARLAEICEEIASRQEKALVFTQFRELTGPLSEFLSQVFGQQGLVLHGGTAVGKRKSLVDRFQQEEGPPFFVLSLKAGGTGLNLTAASHVIHFDRWWNPAVENQATDRAFRIGQRRNVLVHKFVCRGTIEEQIDKMIEEKLALADNVLEAGAEQLLTEMSDQQLLDLVALDVNKAMA